VAWKTGLRRRLLSLRVRPGHRLRRFESAARSQSFSGKRAQGLDRICSRWRRRRHRRHYVARLRLLVVVGVVVFRWRRGAPAARKRRAQQTGFAKARQTHLLFPELHTQPTEPGQTQEIRNTQGACVRLRLVRALAQHGPTSAQSPHPLRRLHRDTRYDRRHLPTLWNRLQHSKTQSCF